MTRITIVHQAALGDTLLLAPLIRSLRQRFGGETQVTLVSKSNLGQLFVMLGWVDGYASADEREHSAFFLAENAELKAPTWAACDVLLSAVSDGKDAWAANARRAMGAALYFFDTRAPAGYAGHVTEWHREQLAGQGLVLAAAPMPLARSNPDGAIVIHPGSGGDAKCWPREKFLALGRTLKRLGLTPTFILGEAEQERWGHKVVADLQEEFPWYLHMGLFELAEKMGRARIYLGNDSGVTHLAAALGVPTVALFGPSNNAQWRPIGPEVQVVRAAGDERDLAQLSEEEVLAELLADLRKIH